MAPNSFLGDAGLYARKVSCFSKNVSIPIVLGTPEHEIRVRYSDDNIFSLLKIIKQNYK